MKPLQITLSDVAAGDFVYLDPPYKLSGRKGYGEYGYGAFNDRDMNRMVTTLRKIDEVGATFLLSYCDAPEVCRRMREWYVYRVEVTRYVAGFSKFRKSVLEMLFSNKQIPDRALWEIEMWKGGGNARCG
jgi:DNA adenine methylase